MKKIGVFFCIFIVQNYFLQPLSSEEELLLNQRRQQAQQTLQHLVDKPRSNSSNFSADNLMRSMVQQVPVKEHNQQYFSSTTIYHEDEVNRDLIVQPQYQSTFEDKEKLHQAILSKLDEVSEHKDQLHNYIKVATALVYYGYKGYTFFKKDAASYALQTDVLDIPYKKMVYLYTKAIEKLLQGAEQKDDICLQIKSLILLCRIPVPQWYAKSFQKGLDFVYKHCFDESGNFVKVPEFELAKIFKEYYRKVPQSWQDIAKISDWWCKNKKPEPVSTKYSFCSMTEHNQQLLEMIELDSVEDLVHLKKMVIKNGSAVATKMYEERLKKILHNNTNEFGIWNRAELDPIWKNLSIVEKQQALSNQELHEILMVRDMKVQQLSSWLLQRYDRNYFVPEKIDNSVIFDAFYQGLATDTSIFDDYDQHWLRRFFISCIDYLVEHKDLFDEQIIFTAQGILKKYAFHPLLGKEEIIYQGDEQKYINSALILQDSFFDQQIQSLALSVADYTKAAQLCHDEIEQIINEQCAKELFEILSK